jgi:hypothetical protein
LRKCLAPAALSAAYAEVGLPVVASSVTLSGDQNGHSLALKRDYLGFASGYALNYMEPVI